MLRSPPVLGLVPLAVLGLLPLAVLGLLPLAVPRDGAHLVVLRFPLPLRRRRDRSLSIIA